jgi:chromosome segregation ATPase
MIMLSSLLKRVEPASAAKIAERLAVAQQSITDAETRIPALRAEGTAVESELRAIFGEQIAEGTADLGPRIAVLRAQRAHIAAEIERLGAEADYARAGLGEAKRRQLAAQWREVREDANAVRAELAALLERAEAILPEIWALDARFPALATAEEEFVRRERLLNEQLEGAGATMTPPHSNVRHGLSAGDTILDPAFAALLSHGTSRVDNFKHAIERIRRARLAAEAARALPLP